MKQTLIVNDSGDVIAATKLQPDNTIFIPLSGISIDIDTYVEQNGLKYFHGSSLVPNTWTDSKEAYYQAMYERDSGQFVLQFSATESGCVIKNLSHGKPFPKNWLRRLTIFGADSIFTFTSAFRFDGKWYVIKDLAYRDLVQDGSTFAPLANRNDEADVSLRVERSNVRLEWAFLPPDAPFDKLRACLSRYNFEKSYVGNLSFRTRRESDGSYLCFLAEGLGHNFYEVYKTGYVDLPAFTVRALPSESDVANDDIRKERLLRGLIGRLFPEIFDIIGDTITFGNKGLDFPVIYTSTNADKPWLSTGSVGGTAVKFLRISQTTTLTSHQQEMLSSLLAAVGEEEITITK